MREAPGWGVVSRWAQVTIGFTKDHTLPVDAPVQRPEEIGDCKGPDEPVKEQLDYIIAELVLLFWFVDVELQCRSATLAHSTLRLTHAVSWLNNVRQAGMRTKYGFVRATDTGNCSRFSTTLPSA